jgi:hypothetical protein
MQTLSIGAKVKTPSGRVGQVLNNDEKMALHYLIQFDKGQTLWILRELCLLMN